MKIRSLFTARHRLLGTTLTWDKVNYRRADHHESMPMSTEPSVSEPAVDAVLPPYASTIDRGL